MVTSRFHQDSERQVPWVLGKSLQTLRGLISNSVQGGLSQQPVWPGAQVGPAPEPPFPPGAARWHPDLRMALPGTLSGEGTITCEGLCGVRCSPDGFVAVTDGADGPGSWQVSQPGAGPGSQAAGSLSHFYSFLCILLITAITSPSFLQ
uniref:Uncharacterized protein n=1 Tax=Myotis myotis TaxID=51298 RepID=A0A7J7S277_MYOMY|nr:hypothetical protein mMyoMyo1_010109 [Myotis myotis]